MARYLAELPHRFFEVTDLDQTAAELTQAGTFMGTRRINLNDGAAIEQFTQTYAYDASGNLTTLKHVGQSQSWTTNMWVSTTSNRAMPALDPNAIMNPGKIVAMD